jgi:hypothetical protein
MDEERRAELLEQEAVNRARLLAAEGPDDR